MDSPEIYELTQTRNELKDARRLLQNLVYHVPEPTTLMCGDALHEAHIFLKRMEELHG